MHSRLCHTRRDTALSISDRRRTMCYLEVVCSLIPTVDWSQVNGQPNYNGGGTSFPRCCADVTRGRLSPVGRVTVNKRAQSPL